MVGQAELRAALAAEGVKFTDAETVYLREDTKIGAGTSVEPFVVFGEGVQIGKNCRIKAFSHLENSTIGDDAIIGPFARVRGSYIAEEAGVGNFVEIARSKLGRKTAAWHLNYIADAEIGENVEIGGGLVTCNFDGFQKHRTIIGNDAFIGSNVTILAPAAVSDGAMIAAASVAGGNIGRDELVISRPELIKKPGGAARYRAKKSK